MSKYNSTSIEDRFPFTTVEESVTQKDWAAGSSKQMITKEFVIKAGPKVTASYEKVKYPPALWKIIDEPIVNAIDHYIRTSEAQHAVTTISATIAPNGLISIYNDGPGIEIAVHKVASEKLGRPMWLPTFIFGTLFQGSNKIQADDSIIGGTNGLGAKLTNCYSSEFIVDITCGGKHFTQTWKNRKSIEHPPVITNVAENSSLPADKRVPHTLIQFMPDYTGLFEYKSAQEAYPLLVDLIRTRMYFAAAYVGPKVKVLFNGTKIDIKSIFDVSAICFPGAKQFTCSITPDTTKATPQQRHYKYPWEVCVVLTESTQFECAHLSNVNGVMVKDGKHYRHLLNLLVKSVKEKIAKTTQDKNLKFSPNYITGNIFIFINAKVPKPSWTGQRKDILDVPPKRLSGYTFEAPFIAKLATYLQEKILENVFETLPEASGKKKAQKVDYDKYKPATKAGTKQSSKCGLIMAEGDSAMSQISVGISHSLGWTYYGIISLGGVIINARKECIVMEAKGGQYVKKSTKLINNIFMNVLSDVTGLNIYYKYDPKSASYEKEMAELKYGYMVACVDQDLDGKGNILGLLLNTFDLFWPNLLKAGYIKWFCTPIIRAYPKNGGTIKAFYTVEDFAKWESTATPGQYVAKYYKGLGSHSRDENIHMYKSFSEHLYTYTTDSRCAELFEIYFGRDPDLRKKELSKPTKDMVNIVDSISKSILCSNHLEYETNLYQKDNLERKLDHIIDGQNQAGRKILDGLIKALKGGKEMKVSQLAGFISEHENYHHGEASLAESITGKGFVATGGKQLPILVPLSNFGSRIGGGQDAASPRYIKARLNKPIVDLIFPGVDYGILPFNFDEGVRSEPKYFVPIIPMAVLESTELPAHGWKLKLWARDVFKVIDNVKRMIKIGDDVSLMNCGPTKYAGAPYAWTGQFRFIRGQQYSFGTYRYEAKTNMIIITELPLRVWNNNYMSMLKKKAKSNDNIIQDIADESGDIVINIKVRLRPGAFEVLQTLNDGLWSDGVEEYFQLRNRMDSHINLMNKDGGVSSFEDYESVIKEWFPVRKEYYQKRINRTVLLYELGALRLENIIRYIEETQAMNLPKKSEATMVKILGDRKYDRLHVAKISDPKFTPTEKIKEIIMYGPKADYSYLLGLSDIKKSAESLARYKAELARNNADLDFFREKAARGRFPGAEMWEDALDELRGRIIEGQRTFWRYGDTNKYEFD
jgi:DNA topoisomerase II